MSTEIELLKFQPQHQAQRRTTSMDVVFVHGLGGDLIKTWQHGPQHSWPQWVADDHPSVQVWSLGYPAAIGHLLQVGESTQLGTRQLAIAIADRLRNATPSVGTRPCVFVCHSSGGLLIKRMLVEARVQAGADIDAFRHANVASVMFLGTPHRGSAVATALNMLDGVKNVSAQMLLPLLGRVPQPIARQVLSRQEPEPFSGRGRRRAAAGGAGRLARCGRVSGGVARASARGRPAAAHRRAAGIRLPGGHPHGLCLGRHRRRRLGQHCRQRGADVAGQALPAQCLGPARHARQCVRMVC